MVNYTLKLIFWLVLFQNSLGSQTNFYLDYTCIGTNRSSSSNIIKELNFFMAEKLLPGDHNSIKGITLTDSCDKKPIKPTAGEQSLFDCSTIAILKRGMLPLGTPVKKYVALRLAGVSSPLALKLAAEDEGVTWGCFHIRLGDLTKLGQDKRDQIQFLFDLRYTSFDDGHLFYVADGEVVRLLLINEVLTEVLWEGVLDSRNFHDIAFNSLIEDLFTKTKFPIGLTPTRDHKFLVLDTTLYDKLKIDWVNPVQINSLLNINPAYIDED